VHLAPRLPADRFRVESIQTSSLENGMATVVVSSAVLHFARDDAEFENMLQGSWRLLASGGLFFCRLATTIGIESQVVRVAADTRRFLLPDGTQRYLVDEAFLMHRTQSLGGQLLDPLKTTIVQNQRAMTTWVVRNK